MPQRTNGCVTIKAAIPVDHCIHNGKEIYLLNSFIGAEKPEKGFISTARTDYVDGTWQEFSVETDLQGNVSFKVISSESQNQNIVSDVLDSSVGNTNCGGPTFFSTFGWRPAQPYEWWYREYDQPDFHALYRVKSAFSTWRAGANRCNSTIIPNAYQSTYKGVTTLDIPYEQNFFLSNFGNCLNPGPKDMVAWATMPGQVLATTCTYTPWYDYFHAIPSRSSIMINVFKKWYTDPSRDGCVGTLYDLQAVATHEVGHTLGLDHFTHIGQSMNPSIGYCATDKRGLGYGDVHGVANLYPPVN